MEYFKGKSSYTVESLDKTLKAQLDFPFKFNIFGATFDTSYNDIDVKFSLSTLLNQTNKVGKDYDWQNDNLTVFSSSDNKVAKFNKISIEVSKTITKSMAIFSNVKYQQLEMIWSNTKQQDFVKNTSSNLSSETLKYQQEFYRLNFGINYKYSLSDTLNIAIKPSLNIVWANNKDTHLLRNFYTYQKNRAFGHGLKLSLNKTINDNKLSIYAKHESHKDNNSDMVYYYNSGATTTLPSSFKYQQTVFGIEYKFIVKLSS